MFGTLTTTLVLALSLAAGDQGEATTWLERLESSAASERGAAERWLAANLDVEDFESLHAAVLTSGAEGRGRLIGILASSERHFALAALLGVDERSEVADVGRESLLELASNWSAHSEQVGARRLEVIQQLGERSQNRFAIDPRAHSLAEAIELLTVAGDTGVMIVVDPDIALARVAPDVDRRTAEVLTGNQAELLASLARSYALGYDGFGLDEPGDMAWVRICRRLRSGKQTARELLVDWSLRVARGKNSADARACARALAGSGWPAATRWLEERWLRRGDEAALAGLRLLAARGFVSPRMRSVAVQSAWLAPDRLKESPEETAKALGALGRVAANGDDLETPLLDEWGTLGAEELWVRLVALELRGSESEVSRERVRASVKAKEGNVAFGYQVLRTAAALNLELDDALSPNRAAALFAHASHIDEGRELVQLLLQLEVDPSHEIDPTGWEPAARLALCEWYFLSERTEFVARAGTLLKELAIDAEREAVFSQESLIARLREWQRIGRTSQMSEWLKTLGPELFSFRLHLGLLDDESADELAKEWLTPPVSSGKLHELAALVAGTEGPRILALLASHATTAASPELELALTEAVRVLRSSRLDSRLESFAIQIRRAGWPQSWPPPPERTPLALRVFERRFEP